MRPISCALLLAVVCGCSNETQITQPLRATMGTSADASLHTRYVITKFSASLGGTVNRGTAINNLGWIAGFSTLPGNLALHAALWRNGAILDLGTLGGPNSSV